MVLRHSAKTEQPTRHSMRTRAEVFQELSNKHVRDRLMSHQLTARFASTGSGKSWAARNRKASDGLMAISWDRSKSSRSRYKIAAEAAAAAAGSTTADGDYDDCTSWMATNSHWKRLAINCCGNSYKKWGRLRVTTNSCGGRCGNIGQCVTKLCPEALLAPTNHGACSYQML